MSDTAKKLMNENPPKSADEMVKAGFRSIKVAQLPPDLAKAACLRFQYIKDETYDTLFEQDRFKHLQWRPTGYCGSHPHTRPCLNPYNWRDCYEEERNT